MNAFLNRILEYKKLPFILGGLIFFSSLALLTVFKTAETQLTQLNNARNVAREMFKSSDDLTAYARYYVTTKNDKWKTEFEKVLQVRNGEIPNEADIRKSFKDKVKEVGFEQNELDLILKAEQLSNQLAKLEIKAFKHIDDYRAEKDYYKLQCMAEPYRHNIRLKSFLTAYGRVKIAEVAQTNINNCIRIHTDGIVFNKPMKDKFIGLIKEDKTTGKINWKGVNCYTCLSSCSV
jgi:hypothetical protein